MMMIKQTEKKIAKNCQRKNVWTELNNVSQKRQDPLLCTKAEENTKNRHTLHIHYITEHAQTWNIPVTVRKKW